MLRSIEAKVDAAHTKEHLILPPPLSLSPTPNPTPKVDAAHTKEHLSAISSKASAGASKAKKAVTKAAVRPSTSTSTRSSNELPYEYSTHSPEQVSL